MGLIVRTVIIVATMAVMSPENQRDVPASKAGASGSLIETGRDLARQAGEQAVRQVSPALVGSVWSAIEPVDREALARTVLDALLEDRAIPAAPPRRTPQG